MSIAASLVDRGPLDSGTVPRFSGIPTFMRLPITIPAEVRDRLGASPAYATFDIDVIEPALAPGTGTPELGGVTTREAQALVRGLRGLNLVGADLVEVAPPFDVGGVTALAGATMMFELLCVLAESRAARAQA